ncbi:MAG: hypothetical protein A2W91_02125 [Bacteroidetes bacterium GWF2_38_335]|nr:MAG: hypothetical protein A2W91_02125 [Bacteroidetes bacterium GWF2_38_335]OFY80650.1 MAG: hypothetical protein A2281_05140 [Bacteroidetes bacterium RIFOXYA12_FULL_38_20]HBS86991.1 hypothetical protein [Bacteroidales bacterium]
MKNVIIFFVLTCSAFLFISIGSCGKKATIKKELSKIVVYNENNKEYQVGCFDNNNKAQGVHAFFDEKFNIKAIYEFKDSILNGYFISFSNDSNIWAEGTLKNGVECGTKIEYYQNSMVYQISYVDTLKNKLYLYQYNPNNSYSIQEYCFFPKINRYLINCFLSIKDNDTLDNSLYYSLKKEENEKIKIKLQFSLNTFKISENELRNKDYKILIKNKNYLDTKYSFTDNEYIFEDIKDSIFSQFNSNPFDYEFKGEPDKFIAILSFEYNNPVDLRAIPSFFLFINGDVLMHMKNFYNDIVLPNININGKLKERKELEKWISINRKFIKLFL